MQNLIATKSLSYGGKRHEVGAKFTAKRQDARLLVAIEKAELLPEDSEEAKKSAKVEPKTKGTYNRRDLKAE